MGISSFRERIFFEGVVTTQDDLGNESSQFHQLFSRWAKVEPMSSREREALGLVELEEVLLITIRFDRKIEQLDTRQVRLRFDGKVYNIYALENMNFSNHYLRLKVTKEVSHEQS